MESNYYEELIQKIETLIKEEDYESAAALIAEEYRMPYIPLDVEEKLAAFSRQLPRREAQHYTKSLSYEELGAYLAGEEMEQIAALSLLKDSNVRMYLPLLQEYLKSDANRFLKGLAIMILINQHVEKEMRMIAKEGEYDFIAAALCEPQDSDGFLSAYRYIADVFEKENPSGAKIAFELLLNECYKKLPESYEEEEGTLLAQSVIRATLYALGAENEWESLKRANGISEDYLWDIKF